MILLLGGTSETSAFATRLAKAGYPVLVSTATDVPLRIGNHPKITRRCGRLNEIQMTRLVHERSIRAIVDVTHPYAMQAHATARRVAKKLKIPCLAWIRPSSLNGTEDVIWADHHEEAAHRACEFKRPVLLTIGIRNLEPYVKEAQRTGVKVVARILPDPNSTHTCRSAGISDDCVVTGRGPFSVETNRSVIRQFGIGVLVTKDSGTTGGVETKLEAARIEGCRTIVVRRPVEKGTDAYGSMDALQKALQHALYIRA